VVVQCVEGGVDVEHPRRPAFQSGVEYRWPPSAEVQMMSRAVPASSRLTMADTYRMHARVRAVGLSTPCSTPTTCGFEEVGVVSAARSPKDVTSHPPELRTSASSASTTDTSSDVGL
jgi:hypothetical protein